MPRREKSSAQVLLCKECGQQIGALYMNNKKEQRPELKKYCNKCRKRMEVKVKVAKTPGKK